jgi:hypothetical protein
MSNHDQKWPGDPVQGGELGFFDRFSNFIASMLHLSVAAIGLWVVISLVIVFWPLIVLYFLWSGAVYAYHMRRRCQSCGKWMRYRMTYEDKKGNPHRVYECSPCNRQWSRWGKGWRPEPATREEIWGGEESP